MITLTLKLHNTIHFLETIYGFFLCKCQIFKHILTIVIYKTITIQTNNIIDKAGTNSPDENKETCNLVREVPHQATEAPVPGT